MESMWQTLPRKLKRNYRELHFLEDNYGRTVEDLLFAYSLLSKGDQGTW